MGWVQNIQNIMDYEPTEEEKNQLWSSVILPELMASSDVGSDKLLNGHTWMVKAGVIQVKLEKVLRILVLKVKELEDRLDSL